MRVSPAIALACCAALWFVSCRSVPHDERGPIATAQRMLALDFSPRAAERQSLAWQRLRASVGTEAQRAGRLPSPTSVLAAELQRSGRSCEAAAATVAAATVAVMARKPRPLPKALRTDPAQWAACLVDALAALPAALRLEHPAMSEPTDRRHRTDPGDDRPEATLAQRLARRLRL